MSTTQEPEGFPIVGYETNRFFILDLDKQVSLDEVKKIAYEIGKRFGLGDCLIIESSIAKQLTLDVECLQNYNLVYGKEVSWNYQQEVLKELNDSGIIGDIRYIRFRHEEQTATLRVSPKHECKPCGKPVALVKITGEMAGIREYLLFLNIGRLVEKDLRKFGLIRLRYNYEKAETKDSGSC